MKYSQNIDTHFNWYSGYLTCIETFLVIHRKIKTCAVSPMDMGST